MIKEKETTYSGEENTPKKTYTMHDLEEATKEILKSDNIGKKLPDAVLSKLSALLAKSALKGDL